MTYAQGGLIEASDYNGFATTGSPNLNQFWSTGSGSSGYGQPGLPTVAAGASALITAAQWDQLFGGINRSALHQGTAVAQLPLPSTYGLITYVSTLQAALNATFAGRLNAAAVGTDIISTGTRTANWGSAVGLATVVSTITVTFASANAARYFFNAGGAVRLTCSRTGGTGSASDLRWSTMCSDLGTLGLPAVNTAQSIAGPAYQGLTKFGGGGLVTVYNRQGYYNLTATPTILYTQYLSSPYASETDNIVVKYSTTGAVVTVRVEFINSSSGGYAYPETVTGNLSVVGIVRPPSSANIANTWGTPIVSVSAPA
jgi:hypothetical protein